MAQTNCYFGVRQSRVTKQVQKISAVALKIECRQLPVMLACVCMFYRQESSVITSSACARSAVKKLGFYIVHVLFCEPLLTGVIVIRTKVPMTCMQVYNVLQISTYSVLFQLFIVIIVVVFDCGSIVCGQKLTVLVR